MDNVPFHMSVHMSREIQQVFTYVGHINLCLPSYSSFFKAANWVFGHINSHVQWNDRQNHWTLLGHINDDVQAINAYMVQGWIRDVNPNFDRASHGEQLRESYTWCIMFCEIKLCNSRNWFCEVVNI